MLQGNYCRCCIQGLRDENVSEGPQTDRQKDGRTPFDHAELRDWIIALQLLTFENNLRDVINLESCMDRANRDTCGGGGEGLSDVVDHASRPMNHFFFFYKKHGKSKG